MRSHLSWDASSGALSAVTGIGPGDVVWLPGPTSSSLFLHGGWHATAVGAQPVARSEPVPEATALHAVPALLARAVGVAEAGGLSHVRLAVVAGDALPPALRARAERLGWRVVEYYGAAELSFVAWRADGGPLRAFPEAEVDVRGGLVWVRSPFVARCYLRPDDVGPWRRDGPWSSVGDVAERVPGGLRLLGRGDAAVTTGGHTVVVEEVEAALRDVDGLLDVAVLGVPDPRLGAVLGAVVVGPATLPGLRSAALGLPAPSRPRRWWSAPVLPRTPMGKVDRTAVGRLVRDDAWPRLR